MPAGIPHRLPQLRGGLFIAYRILWPLMALVALALIVTSYDAELDHQRAGHAFYDLGVINHGMSIEGPIVAPFSAAAKRLFSGDETALAADGAPLGTNTYQITPAMAGRQGATVDLTLRRADGSIHHIAVRRDASYLRDAYRGSGLTFELRRWLEFTFYLIAELMILGTALLLFLRRPRDPVAALIALGWTLVWTFDLSPIWHDQPLLLLGILNALALILITLGVATFPDGALRPRWAWISLAVMTASGVVNTLADYWPWLSLSGTLLVMASLASLAAAVVVRYRATPAGETKQQMKFAMLGFVGGLLFILLFATLTLLSLSGGSDGRRAWLLLCSRIALALGNIAVAAGLLVSLMRYRLYDADAVISRSAAYAFLTLLLGAAFAGSEKVIEVLGEEFFGEASRALAAGLGAAVAATLVAPLHNRVHHWTEKHFQRALSRLREKLPRSVTDMREYAAIDELLSVVGAELEEGVRASHVAVLMRKDGAPYATAFCKHIGEDKIGPWVATWTPDGDAQLECVREDPLFPLRLRLHAEGAGTIGWLLVGPRPDGSFYGKDEREGLIEIADPIARALHIIRERTARDSVVHGRIRSLESELAAIRRLLPPPSFA